MATTSSAASAEVLWRPAGHSSPRCGGRRTEAVCTDMHSRVLCTRRTGQCLEPPQLGALPAQAGISARASVGLLGRSTPRQGQRLLSLPLSAACGRLNLRVGHAVCPFLEEYLILVVPDGEPRPRAGSCHASPRSDSVAPSCIFIVSTFSVMDSVPWLQRHAACLRRSLHFPRSDESFVRRSTHFPCSDESFAPSRTSLFPLSVVFLWLAIACPITDSLCSSIFPFHST